MIPMAKMPAPKATLYTFPRSSWSASTRIARIELGLRDVVEIKQLDFLKAENMSPAYIAMTSVATVPALSCHGRVYCDTTETINYMIGVSPAKVSPHTALTAAVHHSRIDSKFMTFAARSAEELAAKAASGPPLFALTSRLQKIRAYAALPQAGPFREQYAAKIAYVERLISIYTFSAPAEVATDFYVASRALVEASRTFLYETLPAVIGEGPFVAGTAPGADDFHVIGWIVHSGFIAGAQRADGILDALQTYHGAKVPDKIAKLLRAWMIRESFRDTYAGGIIW